MRRIVLPVAVIALGTTCATNPATGAHQISLVSESQEIAIGKQGAEETLATMPVMPDNVQQYVRSVGMGLVGVAERPNLPWNFYVLDDASVNAFAYPGGFIFLTRGILTHMNSEAELAGVMGHEIGHVTARHTAQQLTKQQLAQAGLVVGSVLSSTVAQFAGLASTGLQLMFLKFGRDDEYQADELGFRYMTRKHYDPRAMTSMFTMLQRQGSLNTSAGRLPEWQSTHPDPENRVARNEQRVAAYKSDGTPETVKRDEFLRVLDGMVFGDNPRNGFFNGTTYNHPDLKFKFVFPQGWKTQDQPQAVVGVSSQQDAVIQVSLAKGAPQEALRTFLGQQGMTAGRTSTNPVNGFPAATGEFQAQTQQGTVTGLATYIQYESRTYQILGYTSAQKYQSYVNTFFAAAQSFNRLTDEAALNVQPKRLRLIKLDRDMTIDAFYRANQSPLPFEYIAIINGVEPGALLKAGTLVKTVK
jgi:predicted Zn-dependent protease